MKRIVIVALLAAGCLSQGRKISQESIRKLAARQREAGARLVVISRTTPVAPEVADVVADMYEDSERIDKWTTLTISDFGRAEGDVSLDDDSQASDRALYRREIDMRNQAKATFKETFGVNIDAGGSADLTGYAKLIAGPVLAIAAGIYGRSQKKKRVVAEADKESSKQAVREAIQVIGKSRDTNIRKTAAQKVHLLREFAKIKQEEYDERAEELEQGGRPLQSTLSTESMDQDG